MHGLRYSGFRNLEDGEFLPSPGINIIYGDNAQGKTNLVEALWLFTGGKSFRGAKDSELVRFERDKAVLTLDFNAQNRRQQAEISILGRRSAVLGGIKLPSATALAGVFGAVVFSPAHLTLIEGGPEERRRFIDMAYCQLRPGYMKILSDFNRALAQRNALLRRAGERNGRMPMGDLLDTWDEKLAHSGAQVCTARAAYIRKLTGPVSEVYDGIANRTESMTVHYDSFADQDVESFSNIPELSKLLLTLLRETRETDFSAGYTTVGPHRDNLVVCIDGLDARKYGSQGQKRSAVLALKLAEAAVLRRVTGESPVALLDDVVSELDVHRQDYILNHLGGWQVFLTCCDPAAVQRMTGGSAFCMKKGFLKEG